MSMLNIQTDIKSAMFIDDDQATNLLHRIAAENVRLADDIITHTSATSALDELRDTPKNEFPAFLFVDVNMPNMDGHSFMGELKKLDGYDPKQTCVVFVTGSLSMKDVVLADENEVHCYKWKPLSRNDFMELRGCGGCVARKCL